MVAHVVVELDDAVVDGPPIGEQLGRIVPVLKIMLKECKEKGEHMTIGVLQDFASYPQYPRSKADDIRFGAGLKGELTAGRFVTTIHAINSGIIKLSVLTPVITVYRGMSGLELPKELEIASKFGGKLGIEYSFMSTTTNKNIAIEYGQDTWSGHDLGSWLAPCFGTSCCNAARACGGALSSTACVRRW